MTAINGGGNYVSDGDIMMWLAEQQDRIYGDLKTSMDLSQERADFADQLNEIKSQLDSANHNKDFTKVDAELQDLLTKYGSDPDFADVCQSLKDNMATQIHDKVVAATSGYEEAYAKYQNDLRDFDKYQRFDSTQTGAPASTGSVASGRPQPPVRPSQSFDQKDIDGWSKLIDGKLDTSSKNDQLTMIHIQQLKATIDQSSQLGSQFISSGDKTNDSIIHNIA